MSDTSMKQFFYLAAKNLFGLKISREEFEQSKHKDFDLSENLKCMFDKQNGKIINTKDLNTVNDKNQFIEKEIFNKKLNSNAFAYNYVTQFTSTVDQITNPKSQVFDSITSDSSSEEKKVFDNLEDHAPIILKSTPTPETTQEPPSDLAQTPVSTQQQSIISTEENKEEQTPATETTQEPPSDLAQTPASTQQQSIISTEEEKKEESTPAPETTQEPPPDLAQTPAPTQPIIPSDQTEKKDSQKSDTETLDFSTNATDSEDKKDLPLNSNRVTQYYKSLVNNIFPGYFDMDSESSGYNMEGGENKIFESQKASILKAKTYKSLVNNIFPGYFNVSSESSGYNMEGGENEIFESQKAAIWETKAYQPAQPQDAPITKQDIMNNDNSDSIIESDEDETNQISSEKPIETETEEEDKTNTTEEKKQDENIKDIKPDEIKEKEENKIQTPSFLESNIKGGELPPDSSISQNTQNIILNAFNELTDKKKNNLF